jgi:hypothetical protein
MGRRLLLIAAALPVLAACGTTSTTTVTKLASSSNSTTSTTPATNTATSSATTTATTSTTNAATVYFEGAAGGAVERPGSLQLTADGTLIVNSVQWASWGGPTAVGSGDAEYHGCTPNCAQAPVNTALVSIRLFGVRVCSGRSYYSGVNLTLNSGELLDKQFLQRSWSPC